MVHTEGVEEVVADKGYHSGEGLAEMKALKVRTYIAEPERGRRTWVGKEEQKAAVYGNRRRIQGERGKALLRKRGELLLQAAACNLALVLRQMLGAGTPRGLQDRLAQLFLIFLWITVWEMSRGQRSSALSRGNQSRLCPARYPRRLQSCRPKKADLDTGS